MTSALLEVAHNNTFDSFARQEQLSETCGSLCEVAMAVGIQFCEQYQFEADCMTTEISTYDTVSEDVVETVRVADPPTASPTQAPTRSMVLYLIDANSDTKLRVLSNGDIVDLSRDGTSLTIETVPNVGGVESIVFNLDGTEYRPEDIVPYALGGDELRGYDYLPVQAVTRVGKHRLIVSAHSEDFGGGDEIDSVVLTFEVVN